MKEFKRIFHESLWSRVSQCGVKDEFIVEVLHSQNYIKESKVLIEYSEESLWSK